MECYSPDDFIVVLNIDLTPIKLKLKEIPESSYRAHKWYRPNDGYYDVEGSSSLCHYSYVGEPLGNEVHLVTQEALNRYKEVVPDSEFFHATNCTAGKVNVYNPGCSMRRHVDYITDLVSDQKNGGVPMLTAIYQLQGDYTGGELVIRDQVFPSGDDKVIMFPSNILYPHEVREVTNGQRVSVTAWIW